MLIKVNDTYLIVSTEDDFCESVNRMFLKAVIVIFHSRDKNCHNKLVAL